MEGPLRYVTKEEWGGIKPKWVKDISPPAAAFRLTHTGTDMCFTLEDCKKILQELQAFHMGTMNLPDIRWNFMISCDGTVYEGRGWHAEGYKTVEIKKEFGKKVVYEIGYIGDYSKGQQVPIPIELAQHEFIKDAKSKDMVEKRFTITPLIR